MHIGRTHVSTVLSSRDFLTLESRANIWSVDVHRAAAAVFHESTLLHIPVLKQNRLNAGVGAKVPFCYPLGPYPCSPMFVLPVARPKGFVTMLAQGETKARR